MEECFITPFRPTLPIPTHCPFQATPFKGWDGFRFQFKDIQESYVGLNGDNKIQGPDFRFSDQRYPREVIQTTCVLGHGASFRWKGALWPRHVVIYSKMEHSRPNFYLSEDKNYYRSDSIKFEHLSQEIHCLYLDNLSPEAKTTYALE